LKVVKVDLTRVNIQRVYFIVISARVLALITLVAVGFGPTFL